MNKTEGFKNIKFITDKNILEETNEKDYV